MKTAPSCIAIRTRAPPSALCNRPFREASLRNDDTKICATVMNHAVKITHYGRPNTGDMACRAS
jgi:hypothetical protein